MEKEPIPFGGWMHYSDDTVHEIKSKHDSVNHPRHYTTHPSGVECIQITEHMGFNLGNRLCVMLQARLRRDSSGNPSH